MRLLQLQGGGKFSLVEYMGKEIPQYAILSHTWGADEEEVNFKDLIEGTANNKTGYRKLVFCGKQAVADGLQFFWVDTCCIDKSSSTELSEAINSMFQWYHKAAKCYVYLSDVLFSNSVHNNLSSQQMWKPAFQSSRWFTRGWTLQELLAPNSVEFFSAEGERLGDRISLLQEIHKATGIPVQALQGRPLCHFSVDERISWAEKRQTKREEDAAYSLLGIFDIHMSLIYGEGRKNAFARIERKIKKSREGQLLVTPLSRPSTELSKHKSVLSSPHPSGEDPDLMERSDVPSFSSTYADASKYVAVYEDSGVELRHRAPESGNNPELQVRANVAAISSGERNEIHELQFERLNLEAVLKEVLNDASRSADADERTRSWLRNDCETHDEALADIPELAKENTKDKEKVLIPGLMGDELGEVSRRRGKLSRQVEMFQNATNTHSNPVLHLRQQLTRLKAYAKDKQMHDQLRYTSVHEILQLLLDLKLRPLLESQNTVNDWLDIARFNDKYNVAQYYDKQISSRLEGTCEWIFSHPAYHAWISDEHLDEAAKILWIHAPAGYGKTVLCAKLVEYLKYKQSFLVAYFFASPHAQSGGEPSFIIRSWISQLAQLDPNILELVRRQSEGGQRASESAIWSLLKSIISENRNYAFVLDGFDEYDRLGDVRIEFLQKLKEATKRTASRILITSRDETDISVELSPKVTQNREHIILQCRITNEDVRRDISHFSRIVVDKKLPNKDDRLRQDLAGQLAKKCEGMFLWIKLQQDQLRGGKNAKQLQNIVKNMPIGLEKTYERNWKIIQSHPPEEQHRALAILRWITFALRPLTVAEITEALIVELNDSGTTIQWDDLPDDIDDEYINSEVIDICGALVEVRTEKPGVGAGSRTVHLIHPSVREFLLSTLHHIPADSSQHSVEFDKDSIQAGQHKYLATVCLSYINCDYAWKRHTKQGANERECSFIHYATRHWNLHMTAGNKDDSKLVSLVTEFFHSENKNFDNWRNHVETTEVTPQDSEEMVVGTATPFYYAALFNLPTVMERIWTEDPPQLDKVGGEYGTPLQAVCCRGYEAAFQLLLHYGANPNVQGGRFGVAINAAIAKGQRKMVKVLMRNGVDYTLQDLMGRTPLYTASMNGDSEVVKWLIEAGAKHETGNRYRWTPLHVAADGGYLEVVKLLLEKEADIAAANNDGWTPLNSAAANGHLEVVKLLLEKEADIAAASNNGWTPLNSAADSGHLEVVKLLLEKEADIAAASNNGWTPLNSAADSGHLEVVKLLLEKEADIAAASNNGWTPLNLAAAKGHLEVVKLLLEKEVDTAAASNTGWTPLNSAAANGHLEVVKLLLEKEADIAAASNTGWTPLHSAADRGHLEVVKLFLEKEPDINRLDMIYGSILHHLAFKGYTDLLTLAYEQYNADRHLVERHGRTTLHYAVRGGHMHTLQYLLSLGVNPKDNDTNGDGLLQYASCGGSLQVLNAVLDMNLISLPHDEYWSPLHWACRKGSFEVVERLTQEGLRSECVTTPQLEGQWDPISIAIFHGNEKMLKELSSSCRSLLETGADAVRLHGSRHDGYWCNGCFYVSG